MLNWDEYNKEEIQVAPAIKNTPPEAPKNIEPVTQIKSVIEEESSSNIEAGSRAEAAKKAMETGKSYGTPHDLASLYGRGRYEDNSVPDGYDEKEPLGRPGEKVSKRNTQDDFLGKDRLGAKGMKADDNESDSIRPQFKGGSPLAMESKQLFESLDKKLSLKNKGESLLDESNIKE